MSQENSILSKLSNLSVEQKKNLRLRLDQKAFDGHNIIAQTLKQNGITHVYTISGTPIHKTQPALQRALNSGLAACINVKLDPETPYPSK